MTAAKQMQGKTKCFIGIFRCLAIAVGDKDKHIIVVVQVFFYLFSEIFSDLFCAFGHFKVGKQGFGLVAVRYPVAIYVINHL